MENEKIYIESSWGNQYWVEKRVRFRKIGKIKKRKRIEKIISLII